VFGREQSSSFGIFPSEIAEEGSMSDKSRSMRNRAAKELRATRNGGSKEEKADNSRRAAALKHLAANEGWLDGEKPRGARSMP
jgi:hypothetical protein